MIHTIYSTLEMGEDWRVKLLTWVECETKVPTPPNYEYNYGQIDPYSVLRKH